MKKTIQIGTWLIAPLLLACLVSSCGKKPARDDTLPEITDNWVELEGAYEGSPMQIRINRGLEPVAGHHTLPHQVGITVTIIDPQDNGLPDHNEEARLEKIKEIITANLCAKGNALFAAVVTTSGTREFIFYTGKPEAIETAFAVITGKIYTHTLHLNIQRDRNWGVYKQFSKV